MKKNIEFNNKKRCIISIVFFLLLISLFFVPTFVFKTFLKEDGSLQSTQIITVQIFNAFSAKTSIPDLICSLAFLFAIIFSVCSIITCFLKKAPKIMKSSLIIASISQVVQFLFLTAIWIQARIVDNQQNGAYTYSLLPTVGYFLNLLLAIISTCIIIVFIIKRRSE